MRYCLYVMACVSILVGIIPAHAQYIGDIEKLYIWPPECIGIKCPPVFESSLNALVEPISKSDIVIVGKIIEAKPIPKQNQTEYGIKVDKYIKTKKSFDLITAIGDGIYRKDLHTDEITYYNTPIFKKDDTVFVYLNHKNGEYEISPYSFAISRNIPTGPPPQNSFVAVDKSEYHNKETITILGLIKKAYIFESSLKQTFPISLLIYNPNNQVYENRTLDVRLDGTFSHSFKIAGKLGISGQYGYDVKIDTQTWSGTFLYSTDRLQSPLQQFKSGVSWFEIQCTKDKVSILKIDEHPACVNFESAITLYKRGIASNMENNVWYDWAKKAVKEYFETKLAKSYNIEENSTVIGLVGVRESLPPLITMGLRFTSVDIEEHQKTEHQFWFGVNNGNNIEKILELGRDGKTQTEIPIER